MYLFICKKDLNMVLKELYSYFTEVCKGNIYIFKMQAFELRGR